MEELKRAFKVAGGLIKSGRISGADAEILSAITLHYKDDKIMDGIRIASKRLDILAFCKTNREKEVWINESISAAEDFYNKTNSSVLVDIFSIVTRKLIDGMEIIEDEWVFCNK